MRVSRTRRARVTSDEWARRSVLAHTEHLRSLGEAFVRAADVFLTEQRISELESDWRDDLGRNFAEANREFHRALSESATRVYDIYAGPVEEEDETAETAEAEETVRPRPSKTRPRTRRTATEVGESGSDTE